MRTTGYLRTFLVTYQFNQCCTWFCLAVHGLQCNTQMRRSTASAFWSYEFPSDLCVPWIVQAKQLILTTTKLPKIEAVKAGFQRCFQSVHARGFVCPSGIAPQPFGLQACHHGAQQRIQYLRSMHGANLQDAVLIGMEVGIAELLPGQ